MDTLPQNPSRRIELVGEYDLSQKPKVTALFGSLDPSGPATIDLTRVTYLDSSFLSELVKLRTRFVPHQITLLVPSGNILRLLRLVKFEVLFDIQTAPGGS